MSSHIFTASTPTANKGQALQFNARTPDYYAGLLLEQAGLSSLESVRRAFLGDPGRDVEVFERALGRGFDFAHRAARLEIERPGNWFLFERLPTEGGDALRAKVFVSFEGAAAEFALKLKMHISGKMVVSDVQSAPGTSQLAFIGEGRSMVLAPAEVALMAAASI